MWSLSLNILLHIQCGYVGLRYDSHSGQAGAGWHERIHYSSWNGTQFKLKFYFISGIFCLIFLNGV